MTNTNIHIIRIPEDYADNILDNQYRCIGVYNDKDYNIGDNIQFEAVNNLTIAIPDHTINGRTFQIEYVYSGFGLKDNCIILGFK